MNFKNILFYYLIAINFISFISFFLDKKRAIKSLYRTSESFLFMISLLGGALGSILGMKVFHHKTKKRKFTIGIPIILILNMAFIFYIKQFSV